MNKLPHDSLARRIFIQITNREREASEITLAKNLKYIKMLEDHKIGSVEQCQN